MYQTQNFKESLTDTPVETFNHNYNKLDPIIIITTTDYEPVHNYFRHSKMNHF